MPTNNYWRIRWCKDDVSLQFQDIMNIICNAIETDTTLSSHFSVYKGSPPKFISDSVYYLKMAIEQLNKRETHLSKKINLSTDRARQKLKMGGGTLV